jgi:hypothetical protein
MGKLMERMVLHCLQYTLERRHGFLLLQLGFRKGKSTVDTLHLVKNTISTARLSHECCLMVYLDIEVALIVFGMMDYFSNFMTLK